MKMRLSLYLKFILGYLAFGLLGFVTISTLSSRMMYAHQVDETAAALYDEANLIAGAYSSVVTSVGKLVAGVTAIIVANLLSSKLLAKIDAANA